MAIEPTNDETGPVVELVVFGLKQGVTRDQFLATVPAAEEWMRSQSGYVTDDMTYAASEDRWIEIVRWRTLEEAVAAAQAAETDPVCAPMFGLIDLEDMLFLHGVPVSTSAAVTI